MTDRRLSRESSRRSIILQKKLVESRPPNKSENVPDLTDFMNDMFFGTVNDDKKAYNLTGSHLDDDEEESFDDSTRSNCSRLTQEWLEEARRMMASSPTRCESPSRLVGSPKYAGAVLGRLSTSSVLDRRDPLSRSARRHRAVEGFSGEILIKSAKHSRNKSESLDNLPISPSEPSPASQVQEWFSNILKPSNPNTNQSNDSSTPLTLDPMTLNVPPRQSTYRKSRFQTEHHAPGPLGISVPSRRTFKPAPVPDTQLLSPPKNLIESAHRRSISSTYAQLEDQPLSPPRNLVESAHRRSITRSTCSINERIPPKPNVLISGRQKEEYKGERGISLNGFLKEQRTKIEKILNGEIGSKAKVILSGPTNSTSSMVAAICYAWLLENRFMKIKGEDNGEGYVVVPVMNVRRGRMWKQRQAAWLFQYVGLDATSLLFADEVDLESLIMAGQLTILVVGQDILKTDSEDRSQCTILTDNYCEDAYDLLHIPMLRKLLLAGILLDTQNLNASTKSSMTRDAEAVQLLLVGSAPDYRNTLFNQLMQNQRDNSFFEALRYNYGKPPSESGVDSIVQMENWGAERKSTSISQNQATVRVSDKKSTDAKTEKTNKHTPTLKPAAPAPVGPDNSRGKNKFFLAKWFGFGK
ncbi:uncharacterized protein LOC8278273 [Ricinus communis]|uniref:uncharacterized protein LOC8278273 n=1 Tax=Ricinus communis TaxID=3988 RepID=UPI00201ABA11|nr:uncharacterized protein LOC8278273 [Ricinus communis]